MSEDLVETKFGGAERDTEFPQSRLEYRMDLVDSKAMLRLGHILWYGAERYGVDNWRQIPVKQHIGRCMYHLLAWLGGDRKEDHLGHAFTRAMFALALAED